MAFRVEVKNLDEVKRVLAELGPRVKGVMPAAVEAGGEVLRDRMAAKGPGDGIGVELDGATAYVGPLKEKFYYIFFELGTSTHRVEPRTKKALSWGGRFAAWATPRGIAPAPFMRPAVDEGADAVGEKVGEVLREAIE